MKLLDICLACVAALLFFPPVVWADQSAFQTPALLRTYCSDCHADGAAEGGFDLGTVSERLDEPATLQRWINVFDRIRDGEMPPENAEQPTSAERQEILNALQPKLAGAHRQVKGTVLRRLNRREYENTLNDLFGTHLELAARLPEDGRSHEFDTVGDALDISMVQLRRYLECAEDVLNAATVSTLEEPSAETHRASYADTRGAEKWLNKIWLHRDDGAVVFFKQYGYPTGMLREANAKTSGWYRVRVRGYAYQSNRPITFALGATTFQRGAEKPTFGYFELPPGEPVTVETKVWLPERYMIEITPYGISDPEYLIKKDGVETYPGPGLAIQWVELEGPLVEAWPSRGHHLLFDGLPRQEQMPANRSIREKPWYRPQFEIPVNDPRAAVRPVLQRIARACYRRPVSDDDLAPLLTLFDSQMAEGATVEEALRTSVTAILCSPDFLFLREPPGRLDDHAVAVRLGYFLHRTAPDPSLASMADQGRLFDDPQQLVEAGRRLCDQPHFERFIDDFTDAWLNLREIDFTNPDDKLFPEFDSYLKDSMIEETRQFFHCLIEQNLPVRNLIISDFAMLNERLAEHYGVSGVMGPQIRPVSLPEDSLRGGVLGQGAVLKVSANGTNTSPVVRGVFVIERLLGRHAPPPPSGVPGVEPDIRGASTLRELLAKHRSSESCNSCHRQIDPPGFALECFNPIGGYRDRYRSLGEGEKVDLRIDGRRVRYRLGPPVDASGRLPDGRAFGDYRQFREMLVADEATLARSLLTKLLTFATGREMGFSDREEIDQLVKTLAADQYRVGDMIDAVIASEIFHSK